MIPTVETARLRLRAFRENDLDAHAAMLGDPAIVRFLGGQIAGREETWRKLLAGAGLWAVLGFGYWAVEEKATGAYLGQVGFSDFKRDTTPSIEGLPEIGWMLAASAQGKGLATEAAQGALSWADQALVGRKVVAIISEDNFASIRVAEKIGLGTHEPALYKNEPILLFRRP